MPDPSHPDDRLPELRDPTPRRRGVRAAPGRRTRPRAASGLARRPADSPHPDPPPPLPRLPGVRLVGLTGGIGSGKSTVAALLRARGIPVFDADRAARDLTAPGTPGLAAVVSAFGRGLLRPDGTLDRPALARLVFADPAARARLERILHPRVDAAATEWLAARAAEGCALCVYEAALIFETGRDAWLDGVIAVVADIETRVRRVVERDGTPPEQVRARIAAQLDDAARRRRARWVVANDGTLADLQRRVETLLAELSSAPPPAAAP